MAKRGRPVLEDPRVKECRLRMNTVEDDRLNRVSKDMGMSKADTIRKLIEDYEKENIQDDITIVLLFAMETLYVIGETFVFFYFQKRGDEL